MPTFDDRKVQWLSGSGLWVKSAFDGHKFVCADDFGDDGEKCLVYSFGLSDDTSFEEAMAEAGCEVIYKRAHLIRVQDRYTSDKFAMLVSYFLAAYEQCLSLEAPFAVVALLSQRRTWMCMHQI